MSDQSTPIPPDLASWIEDEAPADAGTTDAAESPAATEGADDPAPPSGEQADQPQGNDGQTPDAAAQTTAPAPVTPPATQRVVPLSELVNERKKFQDRETAAKQDAEHAKAEAEYWRLHATEGKEAAQAFAEKYNGKVQTEAAVREREEVIRSEAEIEQANYRLQSSAEMAREFYGKDRFDAALNALVNEFGAKWVDEQAAQHPVPAKWVVEYGESRKAQDPAVLAAEKEAEIERRAEERYQAKLKETLDKNKTPAHRAAASSVARAPSEAASDTPSWVGKDPEDMSPSELKQASDAERAQRLAKKR